MAEKLITYRDVTGKNRSDIAASGKAEADGYTVDRATAVDVHLKAGDGYYGDVQVWVVV